MDNNPKDKSIGWVPPANLEKKLAIHKDIETQVGFLGYDLNPIATPTAKTKEAIKSNSLEDIAAIRELLNQLEELVNAYEP